MSTTYRILPFVVKGGVNKNMNILKKSYWSKTLVLLLVFIVMASFIPADVGSEDIPLEQFLIITENGMDLNGVFVGKNKGHICSRTGIIRVGPDKVCVPEVPKKEPREGFIGVATLANPTENKVDCCGNKSDLFFVRGNLESPSTCNCKIAHHDPDDPLICADDPEFPAAEEFDIPSGATDVEVPPKGNITIHPDKYRDLIVNNRAKVTLTGPGTYLFRRIIAKPRSKWIIRFDMTPVCDPTVFIVINVKEFVSLAEDGCFGPKENKLHPYGIEPIYLNIAGYDAEYPEDNACGLGYGADHGIEGFENTKAVFCYKGDGQLNLCRVHAPNGTIKLSGRLDTNVQFLSEWFVKVRRKCLPVKIGLMPPCCRPICPCIISHPVQAEIGQEIIVTGMGFSETTVKKILFFKSEKPLTGDRATDLDVDLDYPDEYAEGVAEDLDLEILSARTLKVVVPDELVAGEKYHVTLVNGTFCAGPRSSGMLLEIIP
jgi:hypothetical protein